MRRPPQLRVGNHRTKRSAISRLLIRCLKRYRTPQRMLVLLCGVTAAVIVVMQPQIIRTIRKTESHLISESHTYVPVGLVLPRRSMSTPTTINGALDSSNGTVNDAGRSTPAATVDAEPSNPGIEGADVSSDLDIAVTMSSREPDTTTNSVRVPTPTEIIQTELASATIPFRSSAREAPNIERAAQRIHGTVVLPGTESSFLVLLGEISIDNGYVSGESLVGGEVVPSVGGGICVVSTLLYRAAFSSGLEIVERRGHSRLLSMFNDPPGTDAAVFTPAGDFRWRNDTTAPIEIRATVDAQAEIVTVSLWGSSDGRITEVGTPIVRPARGVPDIWTYDRTLPANAIHEDIGRRTGVVTTVTRTVKRDDGVVVRQERVVSSYAGSAAAVRYGRSVVPPKTVIVATTPEPLATPSPTRGPTLVATARPTLSPTQQPATPTPSETVNPSVTIEPTSVPVEEPIAPTAEQQVPPTQEPIPLPLTAEPPAPPVEQPVPPTQEPIPLPTEQPLLPTVEPTKSSATAVSAPGTGQPMP